MDHDVALKYISALGFPICSSIALGWALWKVGGQLLRKFFEHVDAIGPKLDRIGDSNDEIKQHTAKWPSDLVTKVSDSVFERIRKEFGTHGCNLDEADVRTLLEQHARRTKS